MDEHKPETLTMMDSSSDTQIENHESTSRSSAVANNANANDTLTTSEISSSSAEHTQQQTNENRSGFVRQGSLGELFFIFSK